MGVQVGNSVGVVEEVETDEYGIGWGEYLRVKLRLDITKPLARGRFLKYKGESTWVVFQYELLPRFCFSCGIICHGVGGCLSSKGGHFQGDQANSQFGSWLRASLAFKRPGVEKGWSDRTIVPSAPFHTSSANSSRPGLGESSHMVANMGGGRRGSQIPGSGLTDGCEKLVKMAVMVGALKKPIADVAMQDQESGDPLTPVSSKSSGTLAKVVASKGLEKVLSTDGLGKSQGCVVLAPTVIQEVKGVHAVPVSLHVVPPGQPRKRGGGDYVAVKQEIVQQ